MKTLRFSATRCLFLSGDYPVSGSRRTYGGSVSNHDMDVAYRLLPGAYQAEEILFRRVSHACIHCTIHLFAPSLFRPSFSRPPPIFPLLPGLDLAPFFHPSILFVSLSPSRLFLLSRVVYLGSNIFTDERKKRKDRME